MSYNRENNWLYSMDAKKSYGPPPVFVMMNNAVFLSAIVFKLILLSRFTKSVVVRSLISGIANLLSFTSVDTSMDSAVLSEANLNVW